MATPPPPPGFTEDVEAQTSAPAPPPGFTEDVAANEYAGGSFLSGLARSAIGQGAGLGFGDEIVAGVRSAVGSETYKEALEDERRKLKAFQKKHNVISPIAEIAGGFATPGLGLVAGAIRPAASTLGNVARFSGLGAAVGGVAGAGTAEESRLAGAGKGAAIGAALGPVLPIAGAVASGVAQKARDVLSPTVARLTRGVDAGADEVLANRLRRAGMTPADVAADLAAGQQAAALPKSTAALPETIMDVAPSMQRTGGAVYRTGNEAGDIMQEFVGSRQGGDPAKGLFGKAGARSVPENQYERVVSDFKRAFGVHSKDIDKQIAVIRNEQKTIGNQDYTKAWKTQDEFDIARTLEAWSLTTKNEAGGAEQAALNKALKLFTRPEPTTPGMMRLQARLDDLQEKTAKAAADGKADIAAKMDQQLQIVMRQLEDAHVKIGNAPFPVNNLERFDGAKRSLDGMISETKNDNVKRLLVKFKNDLLDTAHGGDRANPTINKAYAEARDAWGSRAELMEAGKMGRQFLRGSGDVTVADFKAMSNAEKNMFRLGAARELETMLGGKSLGPTTDFTKDLRKPNVYGRLREIMPQGKTSDQMNEIIRRESRMSQSATEVLGNSKTAQRAQDDIELAGRDIAGEAYKAWRSSGGALNLGLDVLKSGFERYFGFRDDMALALAKRLTEANPAQQNQILMRLALRMGNDRFDRFMEFAAKANLVTSGATAATAGRLSGGDSKK
jgi:hypothetical protein